MGICLDTESNTSNQENEDSASDWKGGGQRSAIIRAPKSGIPPMQNAGKVKFDPPKVPVIFILGGPGSGKVTHCDTLMQEKRGVTHINMMDLLQQYAIGNDMQDFSQLSSKTVTEVLMLEMKMSPAAKTYLVSGYPRSMRDVVEYSEKIQVVNGVILISWRQAVLQKQIDYGAKLGHVVLSLAKMELDNFFKNVMPVADYFDQSDMLIAVNGERSPTEVYKDFRSAILDILGAQENKEALLNGVAGMGRGADDIPGSIVSVETAPSQNNVITAPIQHTTTNLQQQQYQTVYNSNPISLMDRNVTSKSPPVIWVIGGPGSNKASLCIKFVDSNMGWGHFSIGRLLRTIAESNPKPNTENYAVKEAIVAGEMVPKIILHKILSTHLLQLQNKKGIIVDGYPRDSEQVQDFEEKYSSKPPIILLDCSKLQLGRGRLDDTVSSFRRRLELFRERTLPMLKEMDAKGRLTIVDGDTDSPSVQKEFERVVNHQIGLLMENNKVSNKNQTNTLGVNERAGSSNATRINQKPSQSEPHYHHSNNVNDAIVHDLENEAPPGVVSTISHHISLANGHLGQNINKISTNGHIPNGRPSMKNLLEDADMDSHM